jgi:hypothetical protein
MLPDFVTESIKWHPAHPEHSEVFSFTRINFCVYDNNKKDEQSIRAWIYDPDKSPHHRDPFYWEVIAPFIELGSSKSCKILLDREYKENKFLIVE